jgi:hypothetical protein
MYDPKDRSGMDVRRQTFPEDTQALVFAEEPDSLGASPAARRPTSLGAVPDSTAAEPAAQKRGTEPAAQKRGGAALAAARGKQAATGSEQKQPASGTSRSGDSNLEAVAKKFQVPTALLKHPDSLAAYAQSFAMIEQQIGLIALEIQVRTAFACWSHCLPQHFECGLTRWFVAAWTLSRKTCNSHHWPTGCRR